MDASKFALHDVTGFPIVRMDGMALCSRGSSSTWCREMDLLLANEERFVLIYGPRGGDEPHEDRVARGRWLKHNKDALDGRCVALLVVEPDGDRRAQLELALPNLVRAFGTPQMACATDEVAVSLARSLIAEGSPRG